MGLKRNSLPRDPSIWRGNRACTQLHGILPARSLLRMQTRKGCRSRFRILRNLFLPNFLPRHRKRDPSPGNSPASFKGRFAEMLLRMSPRSPLNRSNLPARQWASSRPCSGNRLLLRRLRMHLEASPRQASRVCSRTWRSRSGHSIRVLLAREA